MEDLADFEAEQATEGIFVGAEFVANCANDEATLGSGDFTPFEECCVAACDGGVVRSGIIEGDGGDGCAVDRALAGVDARGGETLGVEARVRGDAELLEELMGHIGKL